VDFVPPLCRDRHHTSLTALAAFPALAAFASRADDRLARRADYSPNFFSDARRTDHDQIAVVVDTEFQRGDHLY
jgi:hypothetical protein